MNHHVLQFLTTEHFALQTARSATITDANGRSSLFMGTVSSVVLALAFIAQASSMGRAFFVFALVLLPSLAFLGTVTFGRLMQTAIEDVIHARGINRIRHYYVELAPEMRRYFIHPIHDDSYSTLLDLGTPHAKRQHLLTNAWMVAVINGVIVSVFAGLTANRLGFESMTIDLVVGGAIFIAAIIAHRRYWFRAWAEADQRLPPQFPSDSRDRDHPRG
jgi:hypothetical protein